MSVPNPQALIIGLPLGVAGFVLICLYFQGRMPGTFPYFRRHVRHLDPSMRMMAARALRMGGNEAALPLLKELCTDKDPMVRAETVLSLAVFPAAKVQDLLVQLLHDPAPEVRKKTVACLAEGTDPIVLDALNRMLIDADPRVRLEVIRALGNSRSEETTENLIKLLPTANDEFRQAIEDSLQRIGPMSFEILVRLLPLAGQSASVLVDTLLKLDRQAAFEPMEQILRTTDSPVIMHHLALGLIRVGNPRTQEILVSLLEDTLRPGREYLVEALRYFTNLEVIPPLCHALVDPDRKIRRAAAKVLSGFRESIPLEPLLERLHDEDIEVARLAAMSLGRQNDPRIAPEILPRLFGDEITPHLLKEFEEALGSPIESLSSFFGLVRGLEKLQNQPYTAKLLRIKEILLSLIVVLFRENVRAVRDMGSTVSLHIKGLGTTSNIKEDRLHALARTQMIVVRDAQEASRWQDAS